MKFTKEQKREIEELLKKELTELREIYNEVGEEEISIELSKILSSSYLSLVVDSKKTIIRNYDFDASRKYILEKKGINGFNHKPSNYEIALRFSNNYLAIKKEFLEEAKKIKSKKKENNQKLDQVKKSLNGYQPLEIDYPLTEMNYTPEEIEKINQALDNVINDLNEIWKASRNEETEVDIFLEKFDKDREYTEFKVSQKGFSFEIWVLPEKISYYLARLTPMGEVEPQYEDLSIELRSEFVRKYPRIRERLIRKMKEQKEERANQIETYKENKKNEMANIEEISQMYSRKVDLEIDFPPSINQHTIEVVEEDGQKIGTINFGATSIRIITKGDISLVYKEPSKEKIKTKFPL